MKKLVLLLVLLSFLPLSAQNNQTVYFDFDSEELTPKAQHVLDAWIGENPAVTINSIVGHCDWKGDDPYNDSLSLRRAQNVEAYLKKNNIGFARNYSLSGIGKKFEQQKPQWKNRKVNIGFDSEPAASKPLPQLQEKINNAVVGDKIRLNNINFYNMSDVVVPKSRPVLAELLQIMNDNPRLKIEIQGHICCQLDKEADLSNISALRAKAIYTHLTKNGIASERLSYKGFGVKRPIHPIPEKSEAERDENRRVEIQILSN